MPVMGGIEAIQLIRSTHGDQAPPILGLTANIMDEATKKFLEAGAVGVLYKPLDMALVTNSISKQSRREPA